MEIFNQIEAYNNLLKRQFEPYPYRDIAQNIDWSQRLIGIWGPKGTGKTTVLLSRMLEVQEQGNKAIYLSLDHPLFAGVSLIEIAQYFSSVAGEFLFLDEVHRYLSWSSHIKAIYDTLKSLKVIFSGSSALHIQSGREDLSRRASMHKLPILSFREFLNLETNNKIPSLTLTALLKDHVSTADQILRKLRPLSFFQQYLEHGAYPFYREDLKSYLPKLVTVINHILETDLVFVHGLDARYSSKLKGLLSMISGSVPFVPKITDLAQSIDSRPTVSQYLEYLEQSGLIRMLRAAGRGYQKLSKAEKIYLDNSNLMFALAQNITNRGSIRECFAASQLAEAGHLVEAHQRADILVDSKYVFEIGGEAKKTAQISALKDAYIFSDQIEQGVGNRIPLWMLGLLY